MRSFIALAAFCVAIVAGASNALATDCAGCHGYYSAGPMNPSDCFEVVAYTPSLHSGSCTWDGSTCAPHNCYGVLDVQVNYKVLPPPEECDMAKVQWNSLMCGGSPGEGGFAPGRALHLTLDVRCDCEFILTVTDTTGGVNYELYNGAWVCTKCDGTVLPPY
jgi:hypothetical protein